MARRARKHIPLREKLASVLAEKLPEDERARLREARVPADQILAMFSPDHDYYHTWGGSDEWWNLTMRLRPEHVEKTKRDVGIIAKADRMEEAQHALASAMAKKAGQEPPPPPETRRRRQDPVPAFETVYSSREETTHEQPKRKSQWPQGRKLQSRGFDKRRRPLG